MSWDDGQIRNLTLQLAKVNADNNRLVAEVEHKRSELEDALRAGWNAQNEVERLRGALEGFAEGDCEYGDGCPLFPPVPLNHYRCIPCLARAALGGEG